MKDSSTDAALRTLIRNDLAALALVQGRTEDALEGWKQAINEDPDCQAARLNQGMLLAELERLHGAWILRPPLGHWSTP